MRARGGIEVRRIAVVYAVLFGGCVPSISTPIDASCDGLPGGSDVTYDVAPLSFDEHAADRAACRFTTGVRTTESIGAAVPHGDALPFSHVVVLMLENRSFDHYFSHLPDVGVTDVDVASDGDTNPDVDGTVIHRYHDVRYCIADTIHEWDAAHCQYDDARMDQFVITNNPGGGRAMGYYTADDIPYYYWLASTFTIGDRHFSSMLGPTWPNRFYFYGASSWGIVDQQTTVNRQGWSGTPLITDLMDRANRTWNIYTNSTLSFAAVAFQVDGSSTTTEVSTGLQALSSKYNGSSLNDFAADVAHDRLPELALIDPVFSGGAENDEHPPTNIQNGQQLTAQIVSTLMSNPAVWQKTVLFITYDENGGYYDHVPPPPACVPDTLPPDNHPDQAFDRLGFRVPIIAVSPFARAHYVSHFVGDHTSITRFIENRFDLPALTARDANAWPLLDMFDFSQAQFPTPPTGAPPTTMQLWNTRFCASVPTGGTGVTQ